jgi:hypothetical protein
MTKGASRKCDGGIIFAAFGMAALVGRVVTRVLLSFAVRMAAETNGVGVFGCPCPVPDGASVLVLIVLAAAAMVGTARRNLRPAGIGG